MPWRICIGILVHSGTTSHRYHPRTSCSNAHRCWHRMCRVRIISTIWIWKDNVRTFVIATLLQRRSTQPALLLDFLLEYKIKKKEKIFWSNSCTTPSYLTNQVQCWVLQLLCLPFIERDNIIGEKGEISESGEVTDWTYVSAFCILPLRMQMFDQMKPSDQIHAGQKKKSMPRLEPWHPPNWSWFIPALNVLWW